MSDIYKEACGCSSALLMFLWTDKTKIASRKHKLYCMCIVQEKQHTNQNLSNAMFRILKLELWKLCRRCCNRTTQRPGVNQHQHDFNRRKQVFRSCPVRVLTSTRLRSIGMTSTERFRLDMTRILPNRNSFIKKERFRISCDGWSGVFGGGYFQRMINRLLHQRVHIFVRLCECLHCMFSEDMKTLVVCDLFKPTVLWLLVENFMSSLCRKKQANPTYVFLATVNIYILKQTHSSNNISVCVSRIDLESFQQCRVERGFIVREMFYWTSVQRVPYHIRHESGHLPLSFSFIHQ